MEIKFLDDRLEDFIRSLEKPTIAKVLRTMDLLERFGHQLGMPYTRKVTAGLFELRVRGKQEVRFFYTFSHGQIVILHGFVKKSNRLPHRELRTALARLKQFDGI